MMQEKDSKNFEVVLADVGFNKLAVMKAFRGITGSDLRRAKELVEFQGSSLVGKFSQNEAEAVRIRFATAGATVEVLNCTGETDQNLPNQEETRREELADLVIGVFSGAFEKLAAHRGKIRALKNVFSNLPHGGQIKGCSNWTEFCHRHLGGRTTRGINYMLAGPRKGSVTLCREQQIIMAIARLDKLITPVEAEVVAQHYAEIAAAGKTIDAGIIERATTLPTALPALTAPAAHRGLVERVMDFMHSRKAA